MPRTFAQLLAYRLVRIVLQLIAVTLFGLRGAGRQNFPTAGAALVCANHQSYFDPLLIGVCCSRRMNYLARQSLFKIPLLGRLIAFFDAIPLDRDGGGLGGIKETLKRLKRGEMVLIFPEGTRSADGEMNRLKSGFCTLARRSQAPLVPVGIDGAYQAWPRKQRWPSLSTIHIIIGEPIHPSEFETMTDDELVAELECRIRDCHAQARAQRER